MQSFRYCRSYIILKELEHYGRKWRNLSCFQSYLSNRKQYIECKQDNKTGNTELSNIIWRVPHGSILGPLLFITYVNDLFLKPVRFADDTNLFCKSKTVKTLFIPGLKKFRNGFKQTNYL